MRYPVVVSLLLSIAAFAEVCTATDCNNAWDAVSRTICSDPEIWKADAVMRHSYLRAVKSSNGSELRTMIVRDQRRWISARDNAPELTNLQDPEGPSVTNRRRKPLLRAIQQRNSQLVQSSETTSGRLDLIHRALEERRFLSRFTGGSFAGFDISCQFVNQPEGYQYRCAGTHFYQNHDRVCSVSWGWVKGRLSQMRAVGEVIGGTLKLIATCRRDESECSMHGKIGSSLTGWNVRPERLDEDVVNIYSRRQRSPLPKLDVGIDERGEDQWVESCLLSVFSTEIFYQ